MVAQHLPALLVDVSAPAASDIGALFDPPVSEVRLEIGSGAGEHLIHQATESPDLGFIGVEPFQEGLARTVTALFESGCRNVRLFGDNATLLLDWLPPHSLSQIDLLYPDPWPKRRHWKRRFVSADNLDRMARVLDSGGMLRVVTDIPSYADWSLLAAARHPEFEWTASHADDWRKPWSNWPGTRYEAKAHAAGRTPTYLSFART